MSDDTNRHQVGSQELYRQNILDHNRHPRNKRRMEDASVTHRELNFSCGDDIELFVRTEGNRVADASFDGHGCAISQAAVSMLTEHVHGRGIDELENLTDEEMGQLLGVEVGPARRTCAMLGLEALRQALKKLREDI